MVAVPIARHLLIGIREALEMVYVVDHPLDIGRIGAPVDGNPLVSATSSSWGRKASTFWTTPIWKTHAMRDPESPSVQSCIFARTCFVSSASPPACPTMSRVCTVLVNTDHQVSRLHGDAP